MVTSPFSSESTESDRASETIDNAAFNLRPLNGPFERAADIISFAPVNNAALVFGKPEDIIHNIENLADWERSHINGSARPNSTIDLADLADQLVELPESREPAVPEVPARVVAPIRAAREVPARVERTDSSGECEAFRKYMAKYRRAQGSTPSQPDVSPTPGISPKPDVNPQPQPVQPVQPVKPVNPRRPRPRPDNPNPCPDISPRPDVSPRPDLPRPPRGAASGPMGDGLNR